MFQRNRTQLISNAEKITSETAAKTIINTSCDVISEFGGTARQTCNKIIEDYAVYSSTLELGKEWKENGKISLHFLFWSSCQQSRPQHAGVHKTKFIFHVILYL